MCKCILALSGFFTRRYDGNWGPEKTLTRDWDGTNNWLGRDNVNTDYFTFDYGCEFWLNSLDIRNGKRFGDRYAM